MRVTAPGGIALVVATVALLGGLTAVSVVAPASERPSVDPLCHLCIHDVFD